MGLAPIASYSDYLMVYVAHGNYITPNYMLVSGDRCGLWLDDISALCSLVTREERCGGEK